MLHRLAIILVLLLPKLALALYAEQPLSDPAREAQAQNLFKEIRCVVCEGQTIADSNAELARDMRATIRKDLEQNQSPAAIKAFLTQRYGEEVLMQTPISASTSILWLAPLFVLSVGGALIVMASRKKC